MVAWNVKFGRCFAGVHWRRCAPPPNDERRHARLLGRELKPARGGQPEPRYLGDNAGKPFLPKSLFGDRQDLRRTVGLGIDDAIGMQAHGCESRREEPRRMRMKTRKWRTRGRAIGSARVPASSDGS